jgi:hypothetical protein
MYTSCRWEHERDQPRNQESTMKQYRLPMAPFYPRVCDTSKISIRGRNERMIQLCRGVRRFSFALQTIHSVTCLFCWIVKIRGPPFLEAPSSRSICSYSSTGLILATHMVSSYLIMGCPTRQTRPDPPEKNSTWPCDGSGAGRNFHPKKNLTQPENYNCKLENPTRPTRVAGRVRVMIFDPTNRHDPTRTRPDPTHDQV